MRYQVFYAREDGTKFVNEFQSEQAKNQFVNILKNSGIEYSVLERKDKLWRLCDVVFKLNDIEPAMNGQKPVYTFGDPNEISKDNNVVKVRLENGTVETVYVMKSWLATVEEINEIKARLCREHLGLVVGKPEKKPTPKKYDIGVLECHPANGVLTEDEMKEAMERVSKMQLVV